MALANIYRVVQDLEGNVVTGVLATVTLSGSATLASLFSDAAGTIPLPNPTTNNAQFGSFSLFLAAGTYDMQFVKAGYTFETQRNITLRDPAAGVTTITGTANRVIVAPVPGVGAVTLSTPQDIAPDSTLQFAHLGLGTPGNASYGLDVSTASRFTDTLNASAVAITGGSATGLSALAVVNGNLTVTNGAVGLSAAAVGGTALTVGGPTNIGSSLTVSNDLYVSGGAVGFSTLPVGGRVLSCGGAAWKPGGGAWSDSSSRRMKTNIATIPDALALLLAQQGRVFTWTEPAHAALLPGRRYGLVLEEVTIPQWRVDGEGLEIQGFEALVIEALRELTQRLEALEGR